MLTHAPLIVIVVSRTDPAARIPAWEQDLSAGAVCMNLLHAAHALGFAGTWLTGWAAYSAGAHRLLGITASEKVAGIVYIGTAKEVPADRNRPDIDAIVTRWIPDRPQSDRGDGAVLAADDHVVTVQRLIHL